MTPGSPQAERALLLALAVATTGLFLATPGLIRPWRAEVPWHESAAFFPRLGLLIAALGAVAELWVRARSRERFGSEELDSSAAHLPRALGAVLLFALYALAVPVLGFGVSTALFLLACGLWAGLGWRRATALALPLAALLWAVFVPGLKVAFGHGWLF
jgi:Tripartite tricarboxylate transporter TctB family